MESIALSTVDLAPPPLPEKFERWFAERGWAPRGHQLALLELARAGKSALLIAPTGAGKTLAGFLPSLVELTERAVAPRRLRIKQDAGLFPSSLVGEGAEGDGPSRMRGSDGSENLPLTRSSPGSRTTLSHKGKGAAHAESSSRNSAVELVPPPPAGGGNGDTPQARQARIVDARAVPARSAKGLHTLYVSPLKALAVDVLRNLETPVAEMGLPIRIETRTGDTPLSKRRRQKFDPPDILLTTPEQLALLLASGEAERLFGSLRRIVLDELHAIAPGKRGDLLALDLARLWKLAPQATMVGLSATVADPDTLRRYLVPQTPPGAMAELITAPGGAKAEIGIVSGGAATPWAGHLTLHAVHDVYEEIAAHRLTLVFVNTRMQAELMFQELWRINERTLPIALHHGSLDTAQRRRVEAAMAAGALKAVVCTSTLDLGIDWGDVDLVIHIGAPKGASRLAQRVGRANHRLDEPSRALLVPSNRFEVLECRAAIEANAAGAQDAVVRRGGALDVLAQHVLGMAVAGHFFEDDLYEEVRTAAPYTGLDRATFSDVVSFVATGGYALRTYDRFAKLKQMKDGRWRIANPSIAQRYRMNVGTIIEAQMLKVRLARGGRGPGPLRGGRLLGEVEEGFVETLSPGDTFVFAGEVLRYEALVDDDVLTTRTHALEPKIPSYDGGKFPLSTHLAERVRRLLANPDAWRELPGEVRDWLTLQRARSLLPGSDTLLVETFPRGGRSYLVCYPFEGRLAHQTLGMLLTRRLERARMKPTGFVCNDYALAVWCVGDVDAAIDAGTLSLDALFAEDMLGDDLEAWLAESALMKRTFRNCAIVSGLIERKFPGKEKTGRQVTISTDLVYNVLRRHEPGHILLRAARADAATGLLDIARLGEMLSRIRGRIVHKSLAHVSPLAVPVMLEIGREAVGFDASDEVLAQAEAELIAEAMGGQ